MSYPYESLFYIYDVGHKWGPPDLTWATFVPGGEPNRNGIWPQKRVRPVAVPQLPREAFANKFWPKEAEEAAFLIAKKAFESGTYDVTVTIDDFRTDAEITGFLHLLSGSSGGFMWAPGKLHPARGGASREFEPSADFWDRLVGKKQEDSP